jgi:hypothetical protein
MNEQKTDIKPFLYLFAGIGVYLLLKPILNALGITKSAEAAKQEEENKKNRENYLKPSPADGTPTKSAGEWAIIADRLHRDMQFSIIDDDYDDALIVLKTPKNESDMKLLIKAFGFRQEYKFGIPDGPPKDLVQMVKDNLSRKYLNAINAAYRDRKIKIRF